MQLTGYNVTGRLPDEWAQSQVGCRVAPHAASVLVWRGCTPHQRPCVQRPQPLARPLLQVVALDLADNALMGPAFPPAWLAPGAMPRLWQLVVSNNPNLTGSLPDELAWPKLQTM